MANKERNQNLVVGDTVILRLFVLNSNQYTNLRSIQEIDLFYLDPTAKTDVNPDGRIFIQTLDITTLSQDADGQYSITVNLDTPQFVIGHYIDVWTVLYDDSSNCTSTVENSFQVYPPLWVSSSKPLIYDFDFRFYPNRIVQGSIKYLTVEILPNVPRALELEKYYENLAITSDVSITMIQKCGKCLPKEEDLRTVIDGDSMTFKDRNKGFYLLDTTELGCGIYDVFFTLNFGDTVHISPRFQLEIYV